MNTVLLSRILFRGSKFARLTPSVTKSKARNLFVSTQLLASQAMEDAKKRVGTLKEDPGNDAKLKLYALFKQASTGKCNTKKPGVFDFVGQAKWSAWNGLGEMTQEDAEKTYISYVNKLSGGEEASPPPDATNNASGTNVIDGLDVKKENGICTITYNRPKKLNALTPEMYNGIRDTLNETAHDDSIKVLAFIGAGDYYCSGNDLSNFTKIPPGGPKELAAKSSVVLRDYVNSNINYPKPVVCAVNGPAIGISVTILALADLVYASDTATFHTPFMSLGQSPEGCSSYTFPNIMGYAKANEVLLGGKKLTAQEAFDRNLVTAIIPHDEFRKSVEEKLNYLASLPPKSLMYSKALNREREKEMLMRVNEEECVRLEERWLSDECMNAVMKFLSQHSKM